MMDILLIFRKLRINILLSHIQGEILLLEGNELLVK